MVLWKLCKKSSLVGLVVALPLVTPTEATAQPTTEEAQAPPHHEADSEPVVGKKKETSQPEGLFKPIQIGEGITLQFGGFAKVGDEVNFEYYESLVSHIRKPGDPAPPASDEVALARGTGARPSGAIAEQMSATVTITEMDKDVPSVTIETEDGRTMSVKIADKEILEGVKVGDRVDITYTTAVLITVE